MLKKTITFEDFNGEEVSEDHFFHLSKAELVEMEMSHEGGLSKALQEIIASEDGKEIISQFKTIILGAYGKKSDDDRRFIKNQIIREEFESSEAYSTLFMELVTNTDAAVEFINGVIPGGLAEEMAKQVGTTTPLPVAAVPDEPKPDTEPEVITRAEVMAMSQEETAKVLERVSAGEVKIAE